MGGLLRHKVAMTGATGFIGRAVLRALVEAGSEVTALVRSRHGVAALESAGARVLIAPLRPGADLERALTGAQTLVHLAYDVRSDSAANLTAFDALVAAARAVGIAHMVHTSSVVVYDAWPDGSLDETSPIGMRPGEGYRGAKIAMERRLFASDIPATILQPTIVWGAGGDLWTERPIRAMRAGGLILPEPTGNAPLLHVNDLAAAVVAAVERGSTACARVLVSGPDDPTWQALYEGYRAIAGGTLFHQSIAQLLAATGPPRHGPTKPGIAARLSAHLRATLGRERFDRLLDKAASLRTAGPQRPSRGDLTLFTASPRIAIDKAASLLGWRPAIDLDEGLALLREEFAQQPVSK